MWVSTHQVTRLEIHISIVFWPHLWLDAYFHVSASMWSQWHIKSHDSHNSISYCQQHEWMKQTICDLLEKFKELSVISIIIHCGTCDIIKYQLTLKNHTVWNSLCQEKHFMWHKYQTATDRKRNVWVLYINKEIGPIFVNFPTKKILYPDSLINKLLKILKIPILYKLSRE